MLVALGVRHDSRDASNGRNGTSSNGPNTLATYIPHDAFKAKSFAQHVAIDTQVVVAHDNSNIIQLDKFAPPAGKLSEKNRFDSYGESD